MKSLIYFSLFLFPLFAIAQDCNNPIVLDSSNGYSNAWIGGEFFNLTNTNLCNLDNHPQDDIIFQFTAPSSGTATFHIQLLAQPESTQSINGDYLIVKTACNLSTNNIVFCGEFSNPTGNANSIGFPIVEGTTYYLILQEGDGSNAAYLEFSNSTNTCPNLTASITPENCEGAENGRIDLDVYGGTPPYTYNWSNGQQTADIFNLDGGFYAVTVTDAAGCVVPSIITLAEEFQHTETILIPDNGAAETLEIPLNVSGLPYATLTNADFIVSVCATMEHSWARDLEISLTSPDNQTVILHDHPGQSGGMVFLGTPVDNDSANPFPGTGAQYCWVLNTEIGTMIDYMNSTSNPILPAQSFNISGDASAWEGGAINGVWTLNITDLWVSDNGYLFDWKMVFSTGITESMFVEDATTPCIVCEDPECSDWLRDLIQTSIDSDCAYPDPDIFVLCEYEGNQIITADVSGAPDGAGYQIYDCEGTLIQSCFSGIDGVVVCNPDAGIDYANATCITSVWQCGQAMPACTSTFSVETNVNLAEEVNAMFNDGECLSISNFNQIGTNSAAGAFSSTGFLGMSSGLVLTTGTLINMGNGSDLGLSINNAQLGDASLDLLTDATDTDDATGFEFDFVPNISNFEFEMVFASEDYCTYSSTPNFHDVMGIFLSGPGIAGDFPNDAINLANLPGTSTPVCAFNINPETNANYFIGNHIAECGSEIAADIFAFNGFTTPFQYNVAVIPNQTYHLKVVIADGGDGFFDSALFFNTNFSGNNCSDDCYDPSIITGNPCIQVYDPVCGCDGFTYSNGCMASESGIASTSNGECWTNCPTTPNEILCQNWLQAHLQNITNDGAYNLTIHGAELSLDNFIVFDYNIIDNTHIDIFNCNGTLIQSCSGGFSPWTCSYLTNNFELIFPDNFNTVTTIWEDSQSLPDCGNDCPINPDEILCLDWVVDEIADYNECYYPLPVPCMAVGLDILEYNSEIVIFNYRNCMTGELKFFSCEGTLLSNCEYDFAANNTDLDFSNCNSTFINYFNNATIVQGCVLADELPCNSTPPWDVETCTSLNFHTIFLDRQNDHFKAEINGIPLTTNDWIGVFYVDNQGGEHCQAAVQYPNENEIASLITCIDDFLTPEKDGFAVGENFKFRIWKDGGGEHLDLETEFLPINAIQPNLPSALSDFEGNTKNSYLQCLNKPVIIGDTDCSNPVEVSCGTQFSNLSNATGTPSAVNLFCDSDNFVNGSEVYFRLNNTQMTDVKIAITNLTEDLELYVLDASCDNFACIARSENQETEDEVLLITNLPIGEYYIVVDGYIDATSTFDFEIECGDFDGGGGGGTIDPNDPNDPPTTQCPNALSCNSTANCTTVGLANNVFSYGCTPNHFNGGAEKIFTFESPEDRWVLISMTPEAGVNLDLFVLNGLNAQNNCQEYSIESGDATESFYLFALANKEYYIMVDGFNDAEGEFSLSVGDCIEPSDPNPCPGCPPPPPIVFECDDLDEVFCGIAYQGANANGVSDYSGWGDCSGKSNTGKEIVLEFNNPAPQQILFLLRNMSQNLNLYILDECNPFACLGEGGTKGEGQFDNQEEAVILPFLAAGTYYIVIDGVDNAESEFELFIECDETTFPCLTIPLVAGGTNYISSNILPPNRGIKDIFDEFEGVITSMNDDVGNTYTIGDLCNQNCPQTWEDLDAFAVLINPLITVDTSITVCGVKVDTTSANAILGHNPATDPVKFNYIGYPFDYEQTVIETFAQVANQEELGVLLRVAPDDFNLFTFGPNITDYTMRAGEGYILTSFADRDVAFRASDMPMRENACEVLKMPWAGSINISHGHFRAEVLAKYLNVGDELALMDKNNQVISSFKFDGENASMTIQGDNENTKWREGFVEGEWMKVSIYSKEKNSVFDYIPVFENQSNRFAKGQFFELKTLTPIELNAEVLIGEINFYPNPATDVVTISGAIAEGDLIIMQTIDGRILKQLKSTQNGEISLNLQGLDAGMYLVSVQTAKNTISQKLIKH